MKIFLKHYRFTGAGICFILSFFFGPLHAQELTVTGDEAYDLALVYLATGHTERARQYLDRAVADSSQADLARIEILKLEAEKGSNDQVLKNLILEAEERYQPVMYREAVLSLLRRVDFDPKMRDRAMAWLLDFPSLFAQSPNAAAMKFMAASILQREGYEEAALRLLHSVLEKHPDSGVADDTVVMMARIYSMPGEFHSIQTARSLLRFFRQKSKNSEVYANSIHADPVWKHRLESDPLELFSFYP